RPPRTPPRTSAPAARRSSGRPSSSRAGRAACRAAEPPPPAGPDRCAGSHHRPSARSARRESEVVPHPRAGIERRAEALAVLEAVLEHPGDLDERVEWVLEIE